MNIKLIMKELFTNMESSPDSYSIKTSINKSDPFTFTLHTITKVNDDTKIKIIVKLQAKSDMGYAGYDILGWGTKTYAKSIKYTLYFTIQEMNNVFELCHDHDHDTGRPRTEYNTKLYKKIMLTQHEYDKYEYNIIRLDKIIKDAESKHFEDSIIEMIRGK